MPFNARFKFFENVFLTHKNSGKVRFFGENSRFFRNKNTPQMLLRLTDLCCKVSVASTQCLKLKSFNCSGMAAVAVFQSVECSCKGPSTDAGSSLSLAISEDIS